jgi:dihydrofolate reductase
LLARTRLATVPLQDFDAMKISLVAAMSLDRTIGLRGRLPWHLPADLERFRSITWGKPLLMGRATHESIGRALPGRRNIVLSGDGEYRAPGCEAARSWEEALSLAGKAEEVMVIGGASLYAHFLPLAQRFYLTLIHREFAGDVWFPAFDEGEWREVRREDVDDDGAVDFGYSFIVLERIGALGT